MAKEISRGGIHDVKKCKYCKEWYEDSLKGLRYIEDKELRKKLRYLFKTLWLNNCGDFDIICYEFIASLEADKRKIKKSAKQRPSKK